MRSKGGGIFGNVVERGRNTLRICEIFFSMTRGGLYLLFSVIYLHFTNKKR